MGAYLSGLRRMFDAGDTQAAPQVIKRIAEQTERAQQIIRRLRDQVSKREAERRIEDLAMTIEEANSLAFVGLEKGVKLEISVADDAREALIDKVQIQQVLSNLIRNAVEAMAGSVRREVSIATARVGDMIEICVADTGPGLPETVRARLFEPFVTTKLTGMGVGLSVCRTIVESHGGRLSAADGALGGAVFRLTVPGHWPSQGQMD
jgi:two-component system sensor kinase FixL